MTDSTLARAGFTVTGSRQQMIQATWDEAGCLRIQQHVDVIILRPESIAAFKRAVAKLGVIE